MTSRIIPVDLFDLVVFGATGDLATRKLYPALFHRDAQNQLPLESRIIGASRRAMADDEFRAFASRAITDHVPEAERPAGCLDRFLARLTYVQVDAVSEDGWPGLSALLRGAEERVRVFYLAVGPDLFGPIAQRIGAHGLVSARARVVLEKPIGRDGASAHALNEEIGKVFPEPAIFRIDHYLGKETVQNLMALRFANILFEPLWNAAHIDNVQITVAETLGVEGRAGYYDKAGALRDMVQNHLLQLLCLVAMEPPVSVEGDAVRDEKLKVLKSLKPIAADAIVRGQYRAGASAEGPVPGYLEETGLKDSTTETFLALKAEIGNWRWNGVPFYLRTGKRLPERVSEIVVEFRAIPYSGFRPSAGEIRQNQLVVRLQPDEGVKLWIMIKDPGPGGMRLQNVALDMTFAEAFRERYADAYERLLVEVLRGHQTLFMRRDEVEAAWAWIDPVLDRWASGMDPPRPYTAGTWGPAAAVALIERDGRTWHEDGEA